MASCFGKNGDNLSAKDYSEKKRNLTLFNILRKKDQLEMDNGLRTNTATINKHGNIINYVNYENVINYKKGFEECNKDELKTHYLGQIYKKDECCHLIRNDAGDNLKPPADPKRFHPKYDKEDDECICFNKNNIIKKGEADLVNLIVDGYVDYNCFFENKKKIDSRCNKLDINKLINVRENICCPNKLKWSLLGQDTLGTGTSVAINAIGNIIVIGSSLFDQTKDEERRRNINLDIEEKNDVGRARVFKYNNDTCKWEQLGCDIIGEDTDDLSGISVSINGLGNIVSIGAMNNGENNQGHVRVYQYLEKFDNGETAKAWKQIGQDISSGDLELFGDVINLNEKGDIIAMGGVSSKDNKGYVKIYKFIDNAWQPLGNIIEQTVVESKLRSFRTFSLELNAEGNIVIISYSDSNSVTVYKLEENVWEKVGKTIKEKSEPKDVVYDVSINSKGNIVAVLSSPKYGEILYNTDLVKKDVVWQRNHNDNEDVLKDGLPLSPYEFLETFLKDCDPDDIITIGSGDQTTLWGSIEIKASKLLEIKNYCDGFQITSGQKILPDTKTLDGKVFEVEKLKVYNADRSNYVFVYIFKDLSMGFEDKSNFENNKRGILLQFGDFDRDTPSLSWHLGGGKQFFKGYSYIDEKGKTVDDPFLVNDVEGVIKYILKRPAPRVAIYRFDGELWIPLGKSIKLKESIPLNVKLNSKGDIIAIGSPQDNLNNGCIDIYKFKYNSWEKIGNNICGKDYFGSSIAINYEGNVVIGGAPGNSENSVKVYKYDTC